MSSITRLSSSCVSKTANQLAMLNSDSSPEPQRKHHLLTLPTEVRRFIWRFSHLSDQELTTNLCGCIAQKCPSNYSDISSQGPCPRLVEGGQLTAHTTPPLDNVSRQVRAENLEFDDRAFANFCSYGCANGYLAETSRLDRTLIKGVQVSFFSDMS
jgi:hypothetical protein